MTLESAVTGVVREGEINTGTVTMVDIAASVTMTESSKVVKRVTDCPASTPVYTMMMTMPWLKEQLEAEGMLLRLAEKRAPIPESCFRTRLGIGRVAGLEIEALHLLAKTLPSNSDEES